METFLLVFVILILCFSVLGIIFFVLGLALLNGKKKQQKECTWKTYGKVIDIKRHEYHTPGEHHRYSYAWHPVIEYSIGDLKYIKEHYNGNGTPQYAIGQDIEIYYNSQNPHEYYIANDNTGKTIGTIFTIVGSGFLIIDLIITIIFLL